MNYDKYIELYRTAEKIDIKSILEKDFYEDIINTITNSSFYNVRDRFKEKIYGFIETSTGEKIDVKNLRDKLIRQYFWNETEENLLTYKVYNFLTQRANSEKKYSKNDTDWIMSISLARFFLTNNFEEFPEKIENLKVSSIEIFNSVESCNYFRERGFRICVKKGEIKFNDIDTIFTQLDLKAERIGGAIYDSFTINLIKDYKSHDTGLYRFPTFVGVTDNIRLIPLGLVYQLSLKHLNKKTIYSSWNELNIAYKEFLEFSKHFASLFELQTYGHDFEMILMNSDINLLDKIMSIVFTDNLFKVEQYIYNDVITFVEFLANRALLATNEKDKIAKFLDLVNFYKEKIESKSWDFTKSNLPNDIDDNFLDKFTFKAINQNFRKFNDFDKLDFNTKVFFKVKDRYLILKPEFSCIGLYKILYNLLDELNIYKELSTEIGNYIEQFLEQKMLEKNFNVISGRKYKVYQPEREKLNIKSKELESDFTLQSNHYIGFIEVKKKELTQIAKRGNIIFLLNDLANSLLDSHKQANRHMRYLSEFKTIKFYKVKQVPEIIVNLDNREIVKISVSSLDYLSLHSKDVAQNFIRQLFNKNVFLKDRATEAENIALEKFNQSNEDLSSELYESQSVFQLTEQNGFRNSFFLNIFHLQFLINRSENIEIFFERLISNRNIIMPYRDFYHESIYIQELNNSVIS